jgi:dipeptidyl aminopeptidase/acylaminoacyl peptidase
MQPGDLSLLRIPGEPTITPDGSRVVFAVTRLDLDADAYRSRLWIASTDGGPPAVLTNGPRDTVPRFSPDGRWIAFLRAGDTDDDRAAQVHVMAVDGGEPRRVCSHPLGATAITWSPDSRHLAYVARVPAEGRYGTDPDVPPDKEPPRRITSLKYRLDGVGFTIDQRAHLFTVDALHEDGEPTQLTAGDHDHAEPAWHPDGRTIAFVSARHATRDTDLVADVFVIAVDDPTVIRRVTDTMRPLTRPTFDRDGTTIWFAAPATGPFGETTGLWSVPADGSARPRRLTDADSHDVASHHSRGRDALLVDADGGVTTIRLNRGATELVRFDRAGNHTVLVGGRRQVLGYDAAEGISVAVVTDERSAGEVVAVHNGKERNLTDLGSDLARSTSLRPMQELEATSADGYPVHGWLVKPEGAGPHPVLLTIHGGPHSHYGYELFDETQVYAGAGYAVVMGNPRGSAGYGQDHGTALIGRFGGPDEADLDALLDAAFTDPDLDPRRVGVMGGSYGGFLSAWMAAGTDRFAGAIVERALTAPDSFTGSSDIGPLFVDGLLGLDPEQVLAQSPLARAGRIRIPTLIIHSEQDWRCPVEQAQRLYVALKRNGVATEFLLFPGEGHDLSRSGLPSHRVARFDAILEWWARHFA